MPVATSMEQLEKMLMNEIKNCMNEASNNILEVMRTETKGFYSSGNPSIYVRTGALGDSPETSPISSSGKEVSFDAYLDQSYAYQMPNEAFLEIGLPSHFSTPEVIEAAEAGTAHIKGRPGFWKKAELKMQKTLDDAMRKSFD